MARRGGKVAMEVEDFPTAITGSLGIGVPVSSADRQFLLP